ncbi:MAG TPA: hypothetical protein VFO19_02260 [Vicinamibacterales bacterium]|nr:hypothetical protein [Vicinamibacterales bacterium]
MSVVWGSLAAAAMLMQAPAAPAPTFTRPGSPDAEATLALSALPESLRAGATVYVLGRKGYEKHRSGTNGLTCLVEQSRPDTQEPICWDVEGAETIMPLVIDKAAWRAAGAAEDEIERRAATGFESGKYRAPRRSGVAYMLSADNYVFNGQKVIKYSPHVMFYAPYLTNKDIGSNGKDPNAPWILGEGSPHAYIIVVTKHGK